ncbi:hypothetical protein C8Q77DRAFT_221330 [Trametes polyzona]|nr:hypothetical protein C8Q77DRAFT_221330 [Trametes polyzona]
MSLRTAVVMTVDQSFCSTCRDRGHSAIPWHRSRPTRETWRRLTSLSFQRQPMCTAGTASAEHPLAEKPLLFTPDVPTLTSTNEPRFVDWIGKQPTAPADETLPSFSSVFDGNGGRRGTVRSSRAALNQRDTGVSRRMPRNSHNIASVSRPCCSQSSSSHPEYTPRVAMCFAFALTRHARYVRQVSAASVVFTRIWAATPAIRRPRDRYSLSRAICIYRCRIGQYYWRDVPC